MNVSDEHQQISNSSMDVREVPVFNFVTFLVVTIGVLPVGIAGNLLIIIVVKKKRRLHTTINFLFANLAASDLVASILGYTVAATRAIPMSAVVLGEVLCRINSLYPSASFCSILTLVVIALERYNAIVKPLSPGFKFKKRTVRYFFVGIWIVSFAVAIPLIYFDDYTSNHKCVRTWSATQRASYWTCGIIIGVGIPLLVMLYCYVRIIRTLYFGRQIVPMNIPVEVDAREKKKVINLSIVVTSVFMLSFIPFSVVRAIEIRTAVPHEIIVFSLIFVLLSSILNPFIYTFQSTNYRRAFKEAITCRL